MLAEKKEEQQLTSWNLDKEVATKTKRVRFDNSTTTFSVKIKIKTNVNASRQNKSGSEYSKSVSLPPALNDSAVQAIANQVTQACFTQARTSAGMGNGNIVSTCENSGVNVNVDVNEEEELRSHLSESSFNSNQSTDAEEKSGDEKRNIKFLHDVFGERDASIVEPRRESCYLSRKNFDDGRSITSELTNDWTRPWPSRFNQQDRLERVRNENSVVVSKEHSVRNNFVWKDRNETYDGASNLNANKKSHFIRNIHPHEDPSVSKTTRSPHAISKTYGYGEIQSHSSVSRRQRTKGCSDSLAGSRFGSISLVGDGDTSGKIPREVSLCKLSTRSTGRNISRTESEKTKYASTILCVSNTSKKEKRHAKSKKREVENTAIISIPPSTSRKSRLVPFSPTYRCRECKGCRRTFDCQTCDTCLEKLHLYGSPQSPSAKEGLSLCLSRRCQRTCRVGFVDSLLGLKSSFNPITNDTEEQSNALSAGKSSFYRSSVKHPMDTNKKAFQDSQGSTSKNIKVPWDDGDDWTVDYSYLSEPEYRRHWGKITNCTDSKTLSLSTRRLSPPSWWLPINEKQTNVGFGGGGRTSLSSVSESVVSKRKPTRAITPVSISTNKQANGRRRGGKRKRDLPHGLALPSTFTDVCSIASWRANRKCLRTLMEYDEADQDWV